MNQTQEKIYASSQNGWHSVVVPVTRPATNASRMACTLDRSLTVMPGAD